jgi:hypothetical protein
LKKLQVVDTYQKLLEARNGFGEPTMWEVAREARVSHTYVKNVLDELNNDFDILHPQLNKPQRLKWPGTRTLDSHDVACLIILLRENPSHTLESYRRELFYATGTITSILFVTFGRMVLTLQPILEKQTWFRLTSSSQRILNVL